jgi:hypothetical protein
MLRASDRPARAGWLTAVYDRHPLFGDLNDRAGKDIDREPVGLNGSFSRFDGFLHAGNLLAEVVALLVWAEVVVPVPESADPLVIPLLVVQQPGGVLVLLLHLPL